MANSQKNRAFSSAPRNPQRGRPNQTPTPPRTGRNWIIAVSVIAVAAIAVLVTALLVARPWESLRAPTPAPAASGSAEASTPAVELVTENTHLLSDAGPDAPVLVEFLDFECEACGALYPTMEQVRADYGDRVTIAVRYLPLPGHGNALNAALAVESAAQQGEFEAMYKRMFETQAEWGEGTQSEAPRFRQYASELGLDMARYDADVASQATLDRIDQDYQAAIALGLQSTPSLFLDGEPIELQTFEDVPKAVEAALTE